MGLEGVDGVGRARRIEPTRRRPAGAHELVAADDGEQRASRRRSGGVAGVAGPARHRAHRPARSGGPVRALTTAPRRGRWRAGAARARRSAPSVGRRRPGAEAGTNQPGRPPARASSATAWRSWRRKRFLTTAPPTARPMAYATRGGRAVDIGDPGAPEHAMAEPASLGPEAVEHRPVTDAPDQADSRVRPLARRAFEDGAPGARRHPMPEAVPLGPATDCWADRCASPLPPGGTVRQRRLGDAPVGHRSTKSAHADNSAVQRADRQARRDHREPARAGLGTDSQHVVAHARLRGRRSGN